MGILALFTVGCFVIALYGLGRMGGARGSWPWPLYSLAMLVPVYNLYLLGRFAKLNKKDSLFITLATSLLSGLGMALNPDWSSIITQKTLEGGSAELVVALPGLIDLVFRTPAYVPTLLSAFAIVLAAGAWGVTGYVFYKLAQEHHRNRLIALLLWGTGVPPFALLYVSWGHIYGKAAEGRPYLTEELSDLFDSFKGQ